MKSGLFTQGFSEAAQYVQEVAQKGRRQLHDSNVFGIGSGLRDELGTVWGECREPNWDGFNALAVSQDALRNAYRFLESLPLDSRAPSIGAEPDGALTLEWHHSPRRTLSVSVGPDDELHFAAVFGPNRVYGTEAFFGEAPDSILKLIGQVYAA